MTSEFDNQDIDPTIPFDDPVTPGLTEEMPVPTWATPPQSVEQVPPGAATTQSISLVPPPPPVQPVDTRPPLPSETFAPCPTATTGTGTATTGSVTGGSDREHSVSRHRAGSVNAAWGRPGHA